MARIDESSENELRQNGRRQSVKVDNWDLIYTENNKSKRNGSSCDKTLRKTKSLGPCTEHKNCLLPDLPLDARKVTTLRRHYYPEGGWGWIVIVCTVLVHALNQGLQFSTSQLIYPGANKFKTDPVHIAGNLITY